MNDLRPLSNESYCLAERARALIATSRKLKMEMKQLAEEMERHRNVLVARRIHKVSSN